MPKNMKKKILYREIVVYPHPLLTSRSLSVRKINQDVCDTLDEMAQIMLNYYGIGLATPQIGISKRLIVVQLNKILYQVNQVIPQEQYLENSNLDN
jgi:peptide deformylase